MYQPTQQELVTRRWFPRKPLTESGSLQHIMFPVIYQSGMPKCLCRLCTPALDVRDEEKIQTAYVKQLELELSKLGYVVGQRGKPIE